jgi:hypothetical protein
VQQQLAQEGAGRTTFLVAWLDPLQPVDGA